MGTSHVCFEKLDGLRLIPNSEKMQRRTDERSVTATEAP